MLTEFGPEAFGMFLRNVVINYATRWWTNVEPFRFPTRCIWRGGGGWEFKTSFFNIYSWFRASSLYINKIQQDATDAGILQ